MNQDSSFGSQDFQDWLRDYSQQTWNNTGIPPEFFKKQTASQRQQAQYEAEMRARAERESYYASVDPAGEQVEDREKADYRQVGLICKMASERGWKVEEQTAHSIMDLYGYHQQRKFTFVNPKRPDKVVGPVCSSRKEALKLAALRVQPYL